MRSKLRGCRPSPDATFKAERGQKFRMVLKEFVKPGKNWDNLPSNKK